MTKKHKLIITSLHDAQAKCNCGNWEVFFTGRKTEEDIQEEYEKHIKNYK